MNVLKRIRQTMACVALIAIAGGCNHPEPTSSPSSPPSPRPGTLTISPATTNANQALTNPAEVIELSQPAVKTAPAAVAPASIPAPSPHVQFIASMTEELKTVGTNINVLIQKVNNIEPNAKIDADQHLAGLRQKYQYTSEQLNSLKGTTGAAWDNAEASLKHVMQTLNDAYEDVKAEFTRDGVM